MRPVITTAMHMNRMLPTSVYRLFDAAGRLLYVGMSQDVARRLRQHSTLQAWWPAVARVTTVEYPSRYAARRAERDAIAAENPVHNIADRRECA